MIRILALLLVVTPGLAVGAAPPLPKPQVDHHQHLLSRQMAQSGQQPIDAKALIRMLDDAGIRRAVVLSNAFRYGSPDAAGADEYARVVAENDWTASEAA